MSFSTVLSAAIEGLSAEFVDVEADVSNGLPVFHMVGYLSSEVKEAGERVRTAIRNAGFDYPPKRTVINLSPAALRKRGASFDLPIAVSILISLGIVNPGNVSVLSADRRTGTGRQSPESAGNSSDRYGGRGDGEYAAVLCPGKMRRKEH